MDLKKFWKNNMNTKAFICTIILIIYVIVITVIFKWGSGFIASYILILTLISSLIYVLLAKNKKPISSVNDILNLKELDNVSKLLRYATAVLSFISLMTTAKGLQDFVFSDSEAWLAYLTSFAVQAILVCFSLMYCHIHTAIQLLSTLSERGKSLMLGALTIFLAFAFVTSSCFSFSYIANNAYAQSWANDGEIMIEQYLTQSVSDLSTENKRIGSLLYDEIENRNKSLSNVIDKYITAQDKKLSDAVLEFKLSSYDYLNQEYGLDNKIINSWKRRYPSRAEEIDGLIERFNSCKNNLKSYYNKYVEIKNNLNMKNDADTYNWESVESTLQKTHNDLDTLTNELSSLIDRCETLYISAIKDDISPYRSSLVENAINLKDFVDTQAVAVDTLITSVHNGTNGYKVAGNSKSLPEEMEALQKKIYLLNSTYETNNIGTNNTGTNDTVTKSADVDEIIGDLYDILETYQNDDILNSETVREILELEVLIKEYKRYITLDNQIENYISSNLTVTYNIIKTEDGKTETSGSVVNVTYDEWISQRDRSFLQFFSLLKELPTEPDLHEVALQEEETGVSENNISEVADNKEYHPEDVLYKGNVLRRDLLGEITDYERAFNYFKYDFKTMAFFSAFIAAFFDLGAFLTGCFMYGIGHFKYSVNK